MPSDLSHPSSDVGTGQLEEAAAQEFRSDNAFLHRDYGNVAAADDVFIDVGCVRTEKGEAPDSVCV